MQGDANDYYTHVTHFPRPGCECLWLTNELYHNKKQRHERKYKSKLAAHNWLFYAPPKPDKELEILDKNGFTNEHWLYSHEIDMFDRIHGHGAVGLDGQSISNERQNLRHTHGDQTDGRKVSCPKCQHTFCALCNRPWSSYTQNRNRAFGIGLSSLQSRIYHTHRTCASYQSKTLSKEDDEFIQLGDALDARSCPRCSMRASRIDGCNHMTCVCGFEWCYVCECRWTGFHYGCSDANRREQPDGQCIVS